MSHQRALLRYCTQTSDLSPPYSLLPFLPLYSSPPLPLPPLLLQREATSHLANTDNDSVFEASASESEGEAAGSKPRPPKSPTHAPVDHQAMWYPTIRRTLLCLSKLYRCVERPTFEGLAQEALRGGVHSLQTAASLIAARKASERVKENQSCTEFQQCSRKQPVEQDMLTARAFKSCTQKLVCS